MQYERERERERERACVLKLRRLRFHMRRITYEFRAFARSLIIDDMRSVNPFAISSFNRHLSTIACGTSSTEQQQLQQQELMHNRDLCCNYDN